MKQLTLHVTLTNKEMETLEAIAQVHGQTKSELASKHAHPVIRAVIENEGAWARAQKGGDEIRHTTLTEAARMKGVTKGGISYALKRGAINGIQDDVNPGSFLAVVCDETFQLWRRDDKQQAKGKARQGKANTNKGE